MANNEHGSPFVFRQASSPFYKVVNFKSARRNEEGWDKKKGKRESERAKEKSWLLTSCKSCKDSFLHRSSSSLKWNNAQCSVLTSLRVFTCYFIMIKNLGFKKKKKMSNGFNWWALSCSLAYCQWHTFVSANWTTFRCRCRRTHNQMGLPCRFSSFASAAAAAATWRHLSSGRFEWIEAAAVVAL